MLLYPIQKRKQPIKQQHGFPTCSISALHFFLQVPDVWWWPWPAVTGVADRLSCPIRNQQDWSVSGLPEQRTVGEYTLRVLTGPMTPTDLETKRKKQNKNINLTLHTEEAPPSFYQKDWDLFFCFFYSLYECQDMLNCHLKCVLSWQKKHQPCNLSTKVSAPKSIIHLTHRKFFHLFLLFRHASASFKLCQKQETAAAIALWKDEILRKYGTQLLTRQLPKFGRFSEGTFISAGCHFLIKGSHNSQFSWPVVSNNNPCPSFKILFFSVYGRTNKTSVLAES